MLSYICILGFPGGTGVKNLPAKAGDRGNMGLILGWGLFPWRRKWQPIPIFLPGKSHECRSLVGCSPQSHRETTERINNNRDMSVSFFVYHCSHLYRKNHNTFLQEPYENGLT